MSIKPHTKIQINLALTTTINDSCTTSKEIVLSHTGVECSEMLALLREDWVRLTSKCIETIRFLSTMIYKVFINKQSMQNKSTTL